MIASDIFISGKGNIRGIFFALILFFSLVPLFCEEKAGSPGDHAKYFLYFGSETGYQNQFLMNIHTMLAFSSEKLPIGVLVHGPVLGFETNFDTKNYFWGIKTGYYLDQVIGYFPGLTLRLNALFYYNGSLWDIRLMPEIGFNIFTCITFTLGYSIPMLENTFSGIPMWENRETHTGNFRISIGLKVPLFYYGGNSWKWILRDD